VLGIIGMTVPGTRWLRDTLALPPGEEQRDVTFNSATTCRPQA
jgi:hypothetical protein